MKLKAPTKLASYNQSDPALNKPTSVHPNVSNALVHMPAEATYRMAARHASTSCNHVHFRSNAFLLTVEVKSIDQGETQLTMVLISNFDW